MNIKALMPIFFLSLMGMVNAIESDDSKGSPRIHPHYAESSKTEKRPENLDLWVESSASEVAFTRITEELERLRHDLFAHESTPAGSSPLINPRRTESSQQEQLSGIFGDLRAKAMSSIDGLSEENMRLRNQLLREHGFLWQKSDSASKDRPLEHAVPEAEGQYQGTGADFVKMIYADLRKRTLQVFDGLEQEKHALKDQLRQQSRRPSPWVKGYREKVKAIASSEDAKAMIAMNWGDKLGEASQACVNWNKFLSLSPENQFELILERWNELKDRSGTSAQDYLNYYRRILEKFKDEDILFVYDNNIPITFGNFMRGLSNYLQAAPLEHFGKSDDEKLLGKLFSEFLPASMFVELVLFDDVQYHLWALTHLRLRDLKVKARGIINGMEENTGLKDQLWKEHGFLWQTPISASPDRPQGYSDLTERAMSIVNDLGQTPASDSISRLQEYTTRVASVVGDLEQEMRALIDQLRQQSRRPSPWVKGYREKVKAIASSEDAKAMIAMNWGDKLGEASQACVNWNKFLSLSPENQFELILERWNELKDRSGISAQDYLNYYRRILEKFKDEDILFVYDNNIPITFGNFMRGLSNYLQAAPLEHFGKSDDEKLLGKLFSEFLPAGMFVDLILLDDVQFHSFVLTTFFKHA